MSFLDKMKQAKDMYGNMKKVQSEISKIKCEGISKNGKITVLYAYYFKIILDPVFKFVIIFILIII